MTKRAARPARLRKKSTIALSAKDLVRWRTEIMGLSERDAAIRLGMSRNFLRTCEKQGAPLYVALACAALTKGLEPYTGGGNE